MACPPTDNIGKYMVEGSYKRRPENVKGVHTKNRRHVETMLWKKGRHVKEE